MTPCQECGTTLTGKPRGPRKRFCSTPCRQQFNNRRQAHGADFYDMFMALRYQRAEANEAGVWGFMCRMAEAFRDDDIRNREGRFSWGDWKTFMAENPYLDPSAVVRLPSMKISRRKK